MNMVEIRFPIIGGGAIPRDHRYILYSAIKHRLGGDLSGRDGLDWQLLPIEGECQGELLELRAERDHYLRMRVPKDRCGKVLPLQEEPLRLGNHMLMLGKPTVSPLTRHHWVRSEMVVVRSDEQTKGVEPIDFGFHIGKRLGAMLGHLDFGVKISDQRHIHIAGQRIRGHAVDVLSLTDDESIELQSSGIGEARRMGCGVFEPTEMNR